MPTAISYDIPADQNDDDNDDDRAIIMSQQQQQTQGASSSSDYYQHYYSHYNHLRDTVDSMAQHAILLTKQQQPCDSQPQVPSLRQPKLPEESNKTNKSSKPRTRKLLCTQKNCKNQKGYCMFGTCPNWGIRGGYCSIHHYMMKSSGEISSSVAEPTTTSSTEIENDKEEQKVAADTFLSNKTENNNSKEMEEGEGCGLLKQPTGCTGSNKNDLKGEVERATKQQKVMKEQPHNLHTEQEQPYVFDHYHSQQYALPYHPALQPWGQSFGWYPQPKPQQQSQLSSNNQQPLYQYPPPPSYPYNHDNKEKDTIQICKVEGCNTITYSTRGVCLKHGGHKRKSISNGNIKRKKKKPLGVVYKKRKNCSAFGRACPNQAKRGGYCKTHWEMMEMANSNSPDGKGGSKEKATTISASDDLVKGGGEEIAATAEDEKKGCGRSGDVLNGTVDKGDHTKIVVVTDNSTKGSLNEEVKPEVKRKRHNKEYAPPNRKHADTVILTEAKKKPVVSSRQQQAAPTIPPPPYQKVHTMILQPPRVIHSNNPTHPLYSVSQQRSNNRPTDGGIMLHQISAGNDDIAIYDEDEDDDSFSEDGFE